MIDADIVVVGGGAAGLMCAITASQRGRRTIVLEGSNKIGKKILMSGGGRCNFTNLHTDTSRFISSNPHFCKSALARGSAFDIGCSRGEFQSGSLVIATGGSSIPKMGASDAGYRIAGQEALDVTGHLGGFNFQWARSSGWAAGQAA